MFHTYIVFGYEYDSIYYGVPKTKKLKDSRSHKIILEVREKIVNFVTWGYLTYCTKNCEIYMSYDHIL